VSNYAGLIAVIFRGTLAFGQIVRKHLHSMLCFLRVELDLLSGISTVRGVLTAVGMRRGKSLHHVRAHLLTFPASRRISAFENLGLLSIVDSSIKQRSLPITGIHRQNLPWAQTPLRSALPTSSLDCL
jgi:hypothetical protein